MMVFALVWPVVDIRPCGHLCLCCAHGLDIGQRLVSEIGVVELRVVATCLEQAAMVALFHDPALAHHDDAVGVFDRREPWAITMAVVSRMIASSPSWI